MPTPLEKLLRWAARCFGAIGSRLGAQARALRVRRMEALWPPGTRVRLTCECDGLAHDHKGEWFVVSYAEDAGDYRLSRKMPTVDAPLFSGRSGAMTYARADAFERVSDQRTD